MLDLALEFQRYAIPKEKKAYSGLDKVLNNLIGRVYKRLISPKRLYKRASLIYKQSLEFQSLSFESLERSILEVKKKWQLKHFKSDTDLDLTIALVAEMAFRTLNKRPYEVQLMGVLAQSKNFAIEMLPGEGKTITAAISGIIEAFKGLPCHIITANDYLANRDKEIMQPLYQACHITVSALNSNMDNLARKESYLAMVVYGTSKEFLADFLRDQMKKERFSFNQSLLDKLTNNFLDENLVMRGLFTAIIDEADSVLADEATTPLIISVPINNQSLKDASLVAFKLSQKMQVNLHYEIHERFKEINLTQEGEAFLKKHSISFPEAWEIPTRREFLIKQALIAKHFYILNKQYIIDAESKLVIIDEATGRQMPMRSWGAGLHQAIEIKEGLEVSDPTETHTRMSFQRFFRLYRNLSGMSGTLQGLENEFWHIYKLSTIKIPKKIANTYKLLKADIYKTSEEKWQACVLEIIRVHQTKRPILVGTRSILENIKLGEMLKNAGLSYSLLNALTHQEEAKIIENAGKLGAITIATNMAGRGTDILITEAVANLGGLHVIATSKFESIRVDLQFYGRTARQGQLGSVKPILSLEDNILKQHCPIFLQNLLAKSIDHKLGQLLALFLYFMIQKRADKYSSYMRKQILDKDFSLNDLLSFTITK